MNAPRVTDLGPIRNPSATLNWDVADHFLWWMPTDRRKREELLFGGIDHVGGRRDQPAGLALEGQVLGMETWRVRPASRYYCAKKEFREG